ncbi:MAG TPA: class I SAM-dependent methyltransferase, partial [Ktedonobacteraceae bacterium]|nr:class I SAM-dependent methyltransferase [Ktedonobacteraceae bacterium]
LLSRDVPIKAYGVDISRGQIDVARRRKIDKGTATYEVGDIAELRYPPDVDFVSINFDALNHLRSKELWSMIFNKIYASLKPGGSLVMDVNLPERLKDDWSNPEVIIKNDLVYIQTAEPAVIMGNAIQRRCRMMVFKGNGFGLFTRAMIVVEQYAIPLIDMNEMLKSCGFRGVDLLFHSGSAPVGHIFNKNRAFFSARK